MANIGALLLGQLAVGTAAAALRLCHASQLSARITFW
jgi:hypothetical protein